MTSVQQVIEFPGTYGHTRVVCLQATQVSRARACVGAED